MQIKNYHIDPSNHTLDSIVISCQDVKDVLLHLNVTKASGPDLISPRLLKEGAGIFAIPYFLILLSSLAHLIKDTFPIHEKKLLEKLQAPLNSAAWKKTFLLTLGGSPSKIAAISINLLSFTKFFMALPLSIILTLFRS